MCLCSKYRKLYSADGKYHGRPIPLTKAQPSQVMIKKSPMVSSKYGQK